MDPRSLDKNLTKQTLRIFWEHTKRYRGLFIVAVFGIVGASATRLYEPFLYKRFFDTLTTPHAQAGSLVHVLYLILIINAIGWILHRFDAYATMHGESKVMTDLVNTCFEYLHQHSYSFFNNNFSGSLVRKINRYSKSYEDIADQFTNEMSQTLLRILGIIIVLMFYHITLGLIVLAWTVIFLTFNYYYSMWKLKFDMERSLQDTKVTGQLADTVTNNINLKLFGGRVRENSWFRQLTDDLTNKRIIAWQWANWNDALTGLLMVALEFAVMYGAVIYWQKGMVTVGDFALLQAYLVQMFQQLWNFGRYVRRIYENLADANEMTEILLTPHEVQDMPHAKILTATFGKIEFKNVLFSYQKEQAVLKDFSLEIKPGERVALIGPSGGGKSTIIKLLFRFLDIQGGEILIDDQNIFQVTQESLRKNLALVPQDPILFHRTLMDNIRYAKPNASDDEVMQAARLAHCHEFISNFPEKYETFVGERGVKLSGGERQRVAIARAILKNAPILLLDEATSSLDSESESYIQEALKTLMQNKTTIVIAHRLSTIMQMDRIIVLEKGRIKEQGKHEELLKVEQGMYQKLWEIQAGSFGN